MTTPHEPTTADEWQDAVEWAEVWILVDSARKYGLVRGGAEVDVVRCLELLERGRALGYRPTRVGTDARLGELAHLARQLGKRRNT